MYGSGPSVIATPVYLGPAPPLPQDLPPEIPPNADKWRYMWHEGHYWYYQPSGRWSYWSAGRWVEYSASKYANTPPNIHPPAPQRRFGVKRIVPVPAYPPPGGYGPNVGYGPYGAYGDPPGYYGPAGGVGGGIY
jgi:hypothetical protein